MNDKLIGETRITYPGSPGYSDTLKIERGEHSSSVRARGFVSLERLSSQGTDEFDEPVGATIVFHNARDAADAVANIVDAAVQQYGDEFVGHFERAIADKGVPLPPENPQVIVINNYLGQV